MSYIFFSGTTATFCRPYRAHLRVAMRGIRPYIVEGARGLTGPDVDALGIIADKLGLTTDARVVNSFFHVVEEVREGKEGAMKGN